MNKVENSIYPLDSLFHKFLGIYTQVFSDTNRDIIGAFIMDTTEHIDALQFKIDAQTEKFHRLLQSSLDSHIESIHSTFHHHVVKVNLKVATLRSEAN